jgi:hypothetical protein
MTDSEKRLCAPTRRGFLKGVAAAVGTAAVGLSSPHKVLSAPAVYPEGHPHAYRTSWECGCTGGPIPPKNSDHVVFRWLGTVNFEICYRDQIFLLSNYYDKAPILSASGDWRCPSLGFTAKDVDKATAIFLGHAHFDHMSDTAQVAKQTGAPVFGDKIVRDTLINQGINGSQIIEIKNGNIYQFDGVTVEVVHVYHSNWPSPAQGGKPIMPDASRTQWNALMTAEWNYPPLSDQALDEIDGAHERGSNDPSIQQYGTFAYLFTFGRNFTALMYDSHNPLLTTEFQALMARLGSVDIGTVGYQGGTAERLTEYVWPFVQALNAKYLWPCHNDATVTGREHVATQHIAQFAKNEWPDRHTIISLYREPVTFDIKEHKRISLEME